MDEKRQDTSAQEPAQEPGRVSAEAPHGGTAAGPEPGAAPPAIPEPAVPIAQLPAEVLEKVVIGGDLAVLNAAQRAEYYGAVCRSLGLNPLTKPFEYLNLNGKLRLYALRDCADQLRRLHGISIYIASREKLADIYIVTARAKDKAGREDESTGAVPVGNLKGDALANALMKCETKAKRRVTLSIAGLGWLDETELATIPSALPRDGGDHPLARAPELEDVPDHAPPRQKPASPQRRVVQPDQDPSGRGEAAKHRLLAAIAKRLVELVPGDKDDPVVASTRASYAKSACGTDDWESMTQLPFSLLKEGYEGLLQMQPDQPPALDAELDDGGEPPHPDVLATSELLASLNGRAERAGLVGSFQTLLNTFEASLNADGYWQLDAAERGRLINAFTQMMGKATERRGKSKAS